MNTLLIFLLTKAVRSLIIYDIIYVDPYYKFGKASIYYGVESLRVDSIHNCDKMGWFHHGMCDMTVFARMCYFHERVLPADLDYYMGLKEPSFVINVFFAIKDTYRRYVDCSMTQRYNYPDNVNYNERSQIVGTYSGLLSMYIHYTTLFGERDFDPNLWYSFHVPFFPFALSIYSVHMLQNQVYKKSAKHWSFGFWGYTIYTVFMIAKCFNNYYGIDCWYLCQSNSRIDCKCTRRGNVVSRFCDVTCKEGYLALYASYRLVKFRETMIFCDIIDKCYGNESFVCQPDEICLPIDNFTADCVWILFQIKSTWETNNISSDIFFRYEVITFSYVVKKSKPEYLVNSTFNNIFDGLLENKIISMGIRDSDIEILAPNSRNIYELNLKLYFNDWVNKFILRTKRFRIYELPLDMAIYNNRGELIANYVYINETLLCNSSGAPKFQLITTWYFTCCIDYVQFEQRFTISVNSKTKYMKMTCKITMLAYNRTTFSRSVEDFIFLKVFEYFDWTSQNNIYERTDVLECKATAYINFWLGLQQTEGFSYLFMINMHVYLTSAMGGVYQIICTFTSLVINTYYKTKIFELRMDPTFVCLFFYPSVPGYIIQCGHNGHIPDEYSIQISLYIWKINFYGHYQTSDTYLRLPYTTLIMKYEVICNITSVLGKYYRAQLTWKDTIKTVIEKQYNMTRENIDCASTAMYIEKPEIKEYSKAGITISHNLLLLSKIYQVTIYSIILAVVFILSPLLANVAMSLSVSYSDRSPAADRSNFARIRRLMYARYLHTAILFQSQHLQHPTYQELWLALFKTSTYTDLSVEIFTIVNKWEKIKAERRKRHLSLT